MSHSFQSTLEISNILDLNHEKCFIHVSLIVLPTGKGTLSFVLCFTWRPAYWPRSRSRPPSANASGWWRHSDFSPPNCAASPPPQRIWTANTQPIRQSDHKLVIFCKRYCKTHRFERVNDSLRFWIWLRRYSCDKMQKSLKLFETFSR